SMPIRTAGDRMSGASLVGRIGEQALAGPLGSLDAYLERVSRIAVLSREEERALAERFRSRGDLAAARQLVLSHLRFVVHIARGYRGYGLPVGDRMPEGNVVLLNAGTRRPPCRSIRRRPPRTRNSTARPPTCPPRMPIPPVRWKMRRAPRTPRIACTARCAASMSAAATSCSSAGCPKTRPPCTSWPTSTAYPQSASARSSRARSASFAHSWPPEAIGGPSVARRARHG